MIIPLSSSSLTANNDAIGGNGRFVGNTGRDSSSSALCNNVHNVVIAGAGIMGTSVAYYLNKLSSRRRRRPRQQEPLLDPTAPLFPSSLVSNNNNDDDFCRYNITIIDPVGMIAPCSSGKAGGLLARQWRDGTPLEELQQIGFDLHQELANELATTMYPPTDSTGTDSYPMMSGLYEENSIIGYRRLKCAAISIIEEDDDDYDDVLETTPTSSSLSGRQNRRRRSKKPPSRKLRDVEWVDLDTVLDIVQMGDESNIAQVHPQKLCQAMWDECCKWGSVNNNDDVKTTTDVAVDTYAASVSSFSTLSTLKKGRIVRAVLKENYDDCGTSSSSTTTTPHIGAVELEDGTVLPADTLVIACGPWTYQANDWFDRTVYPSIMAIPDITGVKCHSILVRPSSSSSLSSTTTTSSSSASFTQAVFFESDGAIGDGDLEVYPRPDGDCYVNGFPDDEGLVTERPGEETLDDAALELLDRAMAHAASKELFFRTPPPRQAENIQGEEDCGSSQSKSSSDSLSSDSPSYISSSIQPHTRQVCYWPETADGLPLIGPLPGVDGVYVAAGHSVWGILHGPVTGRAIAEHILDGQSTSVDITPFGLDRFLLQE